MPSKKQNRRERTRRFLKEKHATGWIPGPGFDLTDEKEVELAIDWWLEQLDQYKETP